MQLFYMGFGYLVHGMVDDIVDATEMINSLHDVIHGGVLCGNAESIGIEDKSCLLFCQTATLYMV